MYGAIEATTKHETSGLFTPAVGKLRSVSTVAQILGCYTRWSHIPCQPSVSAIKYLARFRVQPLEVSSNSADVRSFESLKRYKYDEKYRLGLYSGSLSFVVDMFKFCGQYDLANELHRILTDISRFSAGRASISFACRQQLAALEKYVESVPEAADPDWSLRILLAGIRSLGGPSPYTDSDIISMITAWVQGDTVWGKQRAFVESSTDTFCRIWCSQLHRKRLSFRDFCTDVFRYATPGGAPKVEFPKSSSWATGAYRSKWAFGIYHLLYGDIWAVAEDMDPNCNVVVKEEASKTRLIITTPMGSYIRQCYVYYCLGKPKHLRSTLSSDTALSSWSSNAFNNYISVDASKFDYQIPKWWIKHFYASLARHANDEKLVWCCERESAWLDVCVLNYKNRQFVYEKGILSGWRLTSLLGSLASALFCMYLTRASLSVVPFDYITQGDDVLIGSFYELPDITSDARDFGLIISESKSSSGGIGEFLRKVYLRSHIQGYPLRAVKSIFYANAWVDSKQFSNIESQVSIWDTLTSRMAYYSGQDGLDWLWERRAESVHGWLKNKPYDQDGKLKLSEYAITSCLYGGLAPLEWMDEAAPKYQLIHVERISDEQSDDEFVAGILNVADQRASDMPVRVLVELYDGGLRSAFKAALKHYTPIFKSQRKQPLIPVWVNKTKNVLLLLPNNKYIELRRLAERLKPDDVVELGTSGTRRWRDRFAFLAGDESLSFGVSMMLNSIRYNAAYVAVGNQLKQYKVLRPRFGWRNDVWLRLLFTFRMLHILTVVETM